MKKTHSLYTQCNVNFWVKSFPKSLTSWYACDQIKSISHPLLILNHIIQKLGQRTRDFRDDTSVKLVNRLLSYTSLRKQYIPALFWNKQSRKVSMFQCEINELPHIFPMYWKMRKTSTSPKSCSPAAGLSSPSLCASWSESVRAFGTQNNHRGSWRR